MQSLPETVLAYVGKHELLRPGDRVGVAVSGGADSVALLRLLLDLRPELGVILAVAHFNHRLRGAESDEDERFVADLATRYHLEFHHADASVARGSTGGVSPEAAGRKLRYQYFYRLLEGKLDRIATAHTLDDQAETVLLKIARGAGSRGLAGIYPQLKLPGRPAPEGVRDQAYPPGSSLPAIVRPLLSVRRREVLAYLGPIKQDWREDPSNRDMRYARNRVRGGILPDLERELNPAVREALAETAEIARAEEEYWERESERVLRSMWIEGQAKPGEPMAKGWLEISALRALPLALRRRLVRRAAQSLGFELEFRHVEEVLSLAQEGAEAGKAVVLPGGWTLRPAKGELRFIEPFSSPESSDYEYRLRVPGSIEVPQAGSCFEALLVPPSAIEVYNPDDLLDPAQLGQELRVRNWRPGDRFWPAHRKAPKKIKELLEEHHLRGPERKRWPVVVSGGELVWVRGFPVPRRLRPPNGGEAVWIREVRLERA